MLTLQRGVRLADHTTLAVGGEAAAYVAVNGSTELAAALDLAKAAGLQPVFLGGGSNCLVADRGVEACVIALRGGGISVAADRRTVRANAGVMWDDLVSWSVTDGRSGIEALSGIPGRVGAAPIQNIGAYGQELADCLVSVEVLDRRTGALQVIAAGDCGLAYRYSHFKGDWRDRYVVLSVALDLPIAAAAPPRYAELGHRLGEGPYTVAAVRAAVLELRRSKSMVYDLADPNHRSAGSFFVNPVLVETEWAVFQTRVNAAGLDPASVPAWPVAEGHKVSAGWLIERAGFSKGYGRTGARLSSAHCLAITNQGGACAEDLLDLAVEVRSGVLEHFGVALRPEPVLLGFNAAERGRLGLT
jgi:UDP-N-acetylmuramate dehydrogenase